MSMITRILVLDGSAAGESAFGLAACVEHTGARYSVVACQKEAGKQAAEGIGLLAAKALDAAGWGPLALRKPQLVAVVVGPGSFTGLRASCATAAGYALGLGVPVVGVTRGEALLPELEQAVALHTGVKPVQGWMLVTSARKGRVFVETKQGVQAIALAEWQPPTGQAWLVAGDAAASLPLPEAQISGITTPTPEQIAVAACARLSGNLPAREALPLYVDPPEAKRPAAGLRAAPV